MLRSYPTLAALAAALTLTLAGCASGNADPAADFIGVWQIVYLENGEALPLPTDRQPTLELLPGNLAKLSYTRDGKPASLTGTWDLEEEELVLTSADGKLSTRFEIISPSEVRAELPAGEDGDPSAMVLRK